MLRDLIKDVRNAPTAVRERGEALLGNLTAAPQELKARRDAARRWVRIQAHEARESGETRLFQLHLQAIERAEDLIERGAKVSALERVSVAARQLLETVEQATLTPPIAEYDTLNVREITKVLYSLDHLGLLRVRHHEATHKNRKTVIEAVDAEIDKRDRLVKATP